MPIHTPKHRLIEDETARYASYGKLTYVLTVCVVEEKQSISHGTETNELEIFRHFQPFDRNPPVRIIFVYALSRYPITLEAARSAHRLSIQLRRR